MKINPGIFKAYDIRGLFPGEIDETTAKQIGRGFVTYLNASQIAVSRDMRVSSPALAAAFMDGAREQGASVVDYGMLPTDVLYYAVVTDNLEGGAQITASHNPGQYNGIKMVRAEALPLSGSASARTILMPLYCPGLCEAVICAPPSRWPVATAKYIASVGSIPRSTTVVPCTRTPSMNAAAIPGDETRMSRETPTSEAFRYAA